MSPRLLSLLFLSSLLLAGSCATTPKEPVRFSGAPCERPLPLHCQDKDCPSSVTTNQGSAIEPKTGRTYFLDYPCDLRPGEKVTFVLSLHGGGSFGNWHRNYFPLMDYVDKYRLVVATPNSRGWSANDNDYLQNITASVIDQIGAQNVKSFWLAAHSAGGSQTRRMVCNAYYREKVDGVISIGSGRIGSPSSAGMAPGPIPPQTSAAARPAPAASAAPPARPAGPPAGGPPGGASEPTFDCDFSFIFAVGEHEEITQTLPADSSWAQKYGCGGARALTQVVDTRGGYIWDASRQPGNDAWGHEPRPGTAKVMRYPNCKGGRVVADIIRLDKGHTEGMEPNITEAIVKLMIVAPGGKLARFSGG